MEARLDGLLTDNHQRDSAVTVNFVEPITSPQPSRRGELAKAVSLSEQARFTHKAEFGACTSDEVFIVLGEIEYLSALRRTKTDPARLAVQTIAAAFLRLGRA